MLLLSSNPIAIMSFKNTLLHMIVLHNGYTRLNYFPHLYYLALQGHFSAEMVIVIMICISTLLELFLNRARKLF